MGDNLSLFTQAELTALNQDLDTIQKNLDRHVNDSLSKAHSFEVISQPYFDDNGDQVGDLMLKFQFGVPPSNQTIYVPARLASPDPGPSSISSGIVLSTSPTGTALSPGVPLAQKALITHSPAETATPQAEIFNSLLLLHAQSSVNDTGDQQDHGGITLFSENVLDSLGHVVGRRSVGLGINGVLYKLPGDQRLSGPTQPPRISFQEPITFILGGSSAPNFFIAPAPKITIGFGQKPYIFQWQVQNQLTNLWANLGAAISTNGPVSDTGVTFTTKPGISGHTSLSWKSSLLGDFGTLLSAVDSATQLRMTAGKNVHYPFIIRCAISNSGGTTISKTWFCGSTDYNGDSAA
jgi:hypothetical protein